MKKLIDYLLFFAALLVLGVGCQSEEIPPIGEDEPNISEGRTFSLTAYTELPPGTIPPGESVSTRITLTQGENKVVTTWEAGDKLDLLFVQGDATKVKQTVTVSNISDNGKRAEFKFTLPDEIQAGTFDLYGVCGGGGLDDTNPSLAKLPTITGNATSLESLAEKELFMMFFSKKGLSTTSPQASVTFRHLGSLFCLTLKNASGTALTNLSSARLVSSSSGWAYNSGTTQRYYNLVDSAFQNPESAGSYITLYGDGGVSTNETLNFWGWYPPLPSVTWPALTLQLYDKNNTLLGTSSNVKPARTSPTLAGKSYHFYAVRNDAGLHFGAIDADGNFYRAVVIGTQEWFAENLKTTTYNDGTPIQFPTTDATWKSNTTGAYCWYENNEAAYKNAYGPLYNWYAVNTGKLCPTGWHVPTDAEWTTLVAYAGGASVAGGKLKSTRTAPADHPRWDSPNYEATDTYGFSALPGGYRKVLSSSVFYFVGSRGYWWSSSVNNSSAPLSRYMDNNYGQVYRESESMNYGLSVRCLRDN